MICKCLFLVDLTICIRMFTWFFFSFHNKASSSENIWSTGFTLSAILGFSFCLIKLEMPLSHLFQLLTWTEVFCWHVTDVELWELWEGKPRRGNQMTQQALESLRWILNITDGKSWWCFFSFDAVEKRSANYLTELYIIVVEGQN